MLCLTMAKRWDLFEYRCLTPTLNLKQLNPPPKKKERTTAAFKVIWFNHQPFTDLNSFVWKPKLIKTHQRGITRNWRKMSQCFVTFKTRVKFTNGLKVWANFMQKWEQNWSLEKALRREGEKNNTLEGLLLQTL